METFFLCISSVRAYAHPEPFKDTEGYNRVMSIYICCPDRLAGPLVPISMFGYNYLQQNCHGVLIPKLKLFNAWRPATCQSALHKIWKQKKTNSPIQLIQSDPLGVVSVLIFKEPRCTLHCNLLWFYDCQEHTNIKLIDRRRAITLVSELQDRNVTSLAKEDPNNLILKFS